MPPDEKTTNGWNEWSRHVLLELERLSDGIKELDEKIDKNKDELNKKIDDKFQAVMDSISNVKDQFRDKVDGVNRQLIALKVKVALIGGFAGLLISGIVSLVVHWLTKK